MYLSGHDALETTQIFSANKENVELLLFSDHRNNVIPIVGRSTIPMGGRAVFR